MIATIEAPPCFLGSLGGGFEDCRRRGFVRQTAFRSYRAMSHHGEGAFDGVGRSQTLPMLIRKVEEREQRIAVFHQAANRLVVLDAVDPGECIQGDKRVLPRFQPSRCFARRAWPVVAGCISSITLFLVTAYRSLAREVEAFNTPTIRHLTLCTVTNSCR